MTREEYLKIKSDVLHALKQQEQAIRNFKLLVSQCDKVISAHGPYDWQKSFKDEHNTQYMTFERELADAKSFRIGAVRELKRLVKMLAELKVQAAEDWAVRHTV